MRYIKTYESFKTNETLDMFTMPVDPIAGAADVYGDIWNYLKEKASDIAKTLGNKWNEFKDKVSELADKVVELIGDKLSEVIKNIEYVFKSPIQDLTFEDIKKGLQNMPQVQALTKTNEEFDFHPKAGVELDGSNPLSISKDDPLIQKILGIFQFIFKLNFLSCFAPLAAVFAFYFGFFTGVPTSILVTYMAVAIFGVIRTLLYRAMEKPKKEMSEEEKNDLQSWQKIKSEIEGKGGTWDDFNTRIVQAKKDWLSSGKKSYEWLTA